MVNALDNQEQDGNKSGKTSSRLSAYFQAHVSPRQAWFFVATLRSFEHLAFDRTCDVEHSIFEFFVSPDRVNEFERLMSWYQDQGIVQNLVRQDSRTAAGCMQRRE